VRHESESRGFEDDGGGQRVVFTGRCACLMSDRRPEDQNNTSNNILVKRKIQ
jgi:hypothetical protein